MQAEGITTRKTKKEDIPILLQMLKEFAEYEGAPEEFTACGKDLEEMLFDKHIFQMHLIEKNGTTAGFFAVTNFVFIFAAKPVLFLNGIFIREEYRRQGIGPLIIRMLAQKALEEGYIRLDWFCGKENVPSLAFYHKLGFWETDEQKPFRNSRQSLMDFLNRENSKGGNDLC